MENRKRNYDRKKCYAKILFKDDNTVGYLRDISPKGCRIDVPTEITLRAGEKKAIIIIPEEELNIPPIHGTVEVRWSDKKELFWVIGSFLKSVRDREALKNYQLLLEYYKNMEQSE
ncbi:MAG: PilZ domain-containing protein [Spirochaetota bacterium]